MLDTLAGKRLLIMPSTEFMVQVNAIAQHVAGNPTCFPAEVQARPRPDFEGASDA